MISRSGGDVIRLGNTPTPGPSNPGSAGVSTVRVYPTHEGDHLFGGGTFGPGALSQCTRILDVMNATNIELVLDDPFYPNWQHTNEDDWCSVLVNGWEL